MNQVPLPHRVRRAAHAGRGVNLSADELPRVYLAARRALGPSDAWVKAMRVAVLAKRAFRLDTARTMSASEFLDDRA